MSAPLKVKVKESLFDLRQLKRKSSSLIIPRINMLICLKKHDGSLSRR
jgi:hypothetical protein